MKKIFISLVLLVLLTGCTRSFTVSFESNGGNEIKSITVEDNNDLTLPEPPIREGYLFDGWYVTEDLVNSVDTMAKDEMYQSKGFTLYAKWIEVFTITFNDGEDSTEITDLEADEEFTLPTPEKDGYVFNGWFTEESFINKFEETSITIDTVVYAEWLQLNQLLLHDGLNVYSELEAYEGEIVDLPTPEKDGYNFLGWMLGSHVYTEGEFTMLDQPVDLFAKWELPNVHIALLLNEPELTIDQPSNELVLDGINSYIANYDEDTELTLLKSLSFDVTESMELIDRAIEDGANTIVIVGWPFVNVAYLTQKNYPNVKLIFLDGIPSNSDWQGNEEDTIDGELLYEGAGANTIAAEMNFSDVGFLAGYLAVKNGHVDLGFIGAMDIPPIRLQGYGFIAGAQYAAEELGIDVVIKYHYANAFIYDYGVVNKAKEWYESGTEVIFTVALDEALIEAAEATDGLVINADSDIFDTSDVILTSVFRNYGFLAEKYLTQNFIGNWNGGQALFAEIANQGVAISSDLSRMTNFTHSDYLVLMNGFKSGDITYTVDEELEITVFDDSYVNVIVKYEE